jgi:glucosamine--fructose-6-phosphate aminotransferase (isomerizing)
MRDAWADPAATHLACEIREQPEALERLLAESTSAIAAAAGAVRARGMRHVLLAARGSSDNAARYAQYLFGARLGLPAALAMPSLQTMYGVTAIADPAATLAVGISQSGRSPDIVAVLTGARDAGCVAVAITNDPGSPLAEAATHVIPLHAGRERSVAATKTYTASLAAIAALTAAVEGDPGPVRELREIPGAVERAVERAVTAVPEYDDVFGRPHLVAVGRGYNLATAHEIALKLRELGGVVAEAFSPADLMHGPIAALGPTSGALVACPSGRTHDSVLNILPALHARGTNAVVISDAPGAQIPLPRVPEWLSPIVAAVPGQLAALRRAVLTGGPVDEPAGLIKVTRTV